ncbi:MAG: 2-succinyl-5-enolpyruvyl-6-hydroxy-3-cyclohexene-1-carboxylic-acid synthase [Bacteroides sp.]|nr:2-succinyl-5-enolpyruvyl-6-hydroxy-3-cyclohexene-1-carboxylic-acid synthase [Bacteroides sp.]
MYSNKTNIQQLISLLRAHGVKNVVVCPGSRNAPIIHSISCCDDFECHSITDERSAAFFAIGLALSDGNPVVVCCTSGTALLNMYPAVAEAYYQKVPLIILSADRPIAWIGQMDGQTLPQANVFGSLVKLSVNLPEVRTEEDKWYCNRLINQAILETNHRGKGPVHINMPLAEPLFNFESTTLPDERVITRYQGLSFYNNDYRVLIDKLNTYKKRMVVVGQSSIIYEFDKRASRQLANSFVWLAENLSNGATPTDPIYNFDSAIERMNDEEKEKLRPELLITYGGHIISKRLKQYIRKYPPVEHWHITEDGDIIDLYGSLTSVVEINPFEFMEHISGIIDNKNSDYNNAWNELCANTPAPDFNYSGMQAVGRLLSSLSTDSVLHLANSSAVRYAQLYKIPYATEVLCNRGTNGIEGSLSTAIGYALKSSKPNYLVIGDLSFFYDVNVLWNSITDNLDIRILLINNGGGGIFHTLSDLKMTGKSNKLITAVHESNAKNIVESRGFDYHQVKNERELKAAIAELTSTTRSKKPIVVEVITNKNKEARMLKEYYNKIKQQEDYGN